MGYSAGINLYAYCYNDPVNLIDPSGLDPKDKKKDKKKKKKEDDKGPRGEGGDWLKPWLDAAAPKGLPPPIQTVEIAGELANTANKVAESNQDKYEAAQDIVDSLGGPNPYGDLPRW